MPRSFQELIFGYETEGNDKKLNQSAGYINHKYNKSKRKSKSKSKFKPNSRMKVNKSHKVRKDKKIHKVGKGKKSKSSSNSQRRNSVNHERYSKKSNRQFDFEYSFN
jgi:hypothetical protein